MNLSTQITNLSAKESKSNLNQNIALDDSEAMDIEVEVEEIVEPFDPTKIKIDARQITIDLVLNRIKFGEIELSPEFQRASDIWNDKAKSRLIESMLIRIPLPAFYIDATDENRWVVIDGQQRLTAIKQFVLDNNDNTNGDGDSNGFKLSNLEFLTQFDGKSYQEIPRNYQRRINETQITIYLIEKGTPDELKFNIFRRINTGGLPLSSQEIRHAINQGKSTKFLEKLAKSEEFTKATANVIKDKRMVDREIVLRFLAFKITPFLQYSSKELDTFLNNTMKTMNSMNDIQLDTLENDFLKAMTSATYLFGNDAFRKRLDRKAGRSPFNKALFEIWSVNLSLLNSEQIAILKSRKDIIIDEFILLNKDRIFIDSISEGTGSAARVKYRFKKIEELIYKVLTIK